jgi:hypothetical protein
VSMGTCQFPSHFDHSYPPASILDATCSSEGKSSSRQLVTVARGADHLVCCLTTLSVSKPYSLNDKAINECGAA